MEYLLGIDVGTTACKAVLFDTDANKIDVFRKDYQLQCPQNGWAELDPTELWNAVKFCIHRITEQNKGKISALAVSSQGEGVLPLDEKGEALGPVIVAFDTRSYEHANELEREFGHQYFFEKSGQILSSAGSVTKIMWMKKNLKLSKKPHAYVCVEDYITMKLSGERIIDYSMAARTMMFDMDKMHWNEEVLTYAGIDKFQLSYPTQGGTPVGTLKKEVAYETGLSVNTLVVSGGHDQCCAILGTGVFCSGEAAYSLGTTETLICNMDSFQEGLYQYGLPCYPHILKNQYITLPGNFTGGNLLQWYKDTFADSENTLAKERKQNVYDILIEEMLDKPSNLLVLPHFTMTGSPWNDTHSHGMMTGLKLNTTKGEFIRGLLEGVTFEILLNIELLKEVGIQINHLIAAGGSTKSEKLMQLKSDVLGVPISVYKDTEAACKGAAFLAGCGSGILVSEQENWCNSGKKVCFAPDFKKHGQYLKKLVKYKKMYAAQKEILGS